MVYEKKYKEALEEAKKLYGKYCIDNVLENIFPELKESEDERKRKAILTGLIDCRDAPDLGWSNFGGINIDECISWLEKQDKQSYLNIPSRETILAVWELGNDWKDLTNSSISTEYGTQLDYIQKHWHESEYYLKEKQGKQTQLDYEHADIPQKDFATIEPKFKVGDWIIFNGLILRIDEVVNGYYITTSIGDDIHNSYDWDIDNVARLWTIKDAKDGDILVNSKGNPFIFTGKFTTNYHNLIAYCGIDDDNKLIVCTLGWTSKNGVSPATKEQRNLLFAKMNKAGYEWDAEKKEVKKIEVASKESKDEKIRKGLIKAVSRIFEGNKLFDTDVTREEALAWLEKQKGD